MKKISSILLAVSFALLLPSSAFAFGAIAVDDEVGDSEPGYGYVIGMDSEKEAKAGALKQCRESGNENCKVAVWFKKCGAYAASKKHYGIGYGNSKSIAESKALEECGGSCKIMVSDCE